MGLCKHCKDRSSFSCESVGAIPPLTIAAFAETVASFMIGKPSPEDQELGQANKYKIL